MRRAVELSCNHEAHEFLIVFVLREECGECDRGKSRSREGRGKKNKIAQGWKRVNNDETESIKIFQGWNRVNKTLISDVINYNSDIKYKESESKNDSRKRTM